MRRDVNAQCATFIGDAPGNGGALFGFTNVSDPSDDSNTVRADPDSDLLWDAVHPTAAAHAYIGAAAFAEVSAVPLPAAAWMLVPAFGVLAARRPTSLTSQLGAALAPGPGLLERSGDTEHAEIVEGPADNLQPGRHVAVTESARYTHRRAPGEVVEQPRR